MSLIVHHRVGGWLPRDHHVLEAWLDKKLKKAEARQYTPESFAPVIREFQHLIESDPEIYMGFHQMFEQVPLKPPYNNDPTGKCQVNFGFFDCYLNHFISKKRVLLGSQLYENVGAL